VEARRAARSIAPTGVAASAWSAGSFPGVGYVVQIRNPPMTRRAPLRHLRIRAKLFLAFSAVSGLVIASAIAGIIWTRNSDAEILRNLALLELAKRQSTVVELNLMTMSDAMRGYLLDPANKAEIRRKLAADDELGTVVEELKVALIAIPSVLQRIIELETYDDQHLNKAEDHLVEVAGEDIDTAKRLYKTDYLPMREREIGLVLALRHEVAQVEEALKVKAARTHVKQLSLGVAAAVMMLTLSALVAWLCARAIGDQIRGMTAAMGKLADGDTMIEIPARDSKDEIGDMARAVEVFRENLIARRLGEITLRRTNLQFDAALNSMLQGMIVWSPDHRVQLVNRRFYAIAGIPEYSIVSGTTARQFADIAVSHGLHPGENPSDVTDRIMTLLNSRRSVQFELEMCPRLFVQVAGEPMTNGGTVVTYEDVTEKRESQAQIAYMARHDALTGLPNRTLFQERMDAVLGEADEPHAGQVAPFAVLCLDLDHFKEVNDTLGHPAGDELLRLVSARLRNCVRDHDMLARLGGDEFAVVIASPDGSAALAAALAARLVQTIGAPYELRAHNIVIGTSIGIALSEPGVSGADMLKRADVALYRAKEERGTFAVFEPSMDKQLQARLGMETDLRLALQRGEFELYYQPLFNLIEDRVTAFEALIRWNSPTRGRVAPVDFIPLAEQTGLIIPIGEWVLRTACAEAVLWPAHVRVAVNLSAIQTKTKNLVALVSETLADTGLSARRLELEITETVLLQNTETIIVMLHTLHDMGVRISMDDFGTGYSSLSYLRRFPFDKIKIDRSFITDLRGTPSTPERAENPSEAGSATEKSAATIVRAIVGLGDSLGISTTAEGVETAQQFARVRQKGCTEVQGYFISPPRPAKEVAELLRRLDATLPSIANSPRVSPQLVTSQKSSVPVDTTPWMQEQRGEI
jgi:diguanylate cyclase (GGDEF)-like protein